jgi:Holliday junction DNA helicase RuvA
VIAYLKGRLVAMDSSSAILEVNGVGFRLGMSTLALAALEPIGSELTIFTKMIVREDAMTLFGFANLAEQEMFERLLTVSGVGPKVALSALSTFPAETIQKLILDEDVKRLSTISGLGKKTAQRIILELAGVLASSAAEVAEGVATAGGKQSSVSVSAQVLEALIGMGFTSSEAELAIQGYGSGENLSDAGADAVEDGAIAAGQASTATRAIPSVDPSADAADLLRYALKRLGAKA